MITRIGEPVYSTASLSPAGTDTEMAGRAVSAQEAPLAPTTTATVFARMRRSAAMVSSSM